MICRIPAKINTTAKQHLKYRNDCLKTIRKSPRNMHFVMDVSSFAHSTGRILHGSIQSIIKNGRRGGHSFSIINPYDHGGITDFMTVWNYNDTYVQVFKVYEFTEHNSMAMTYQLSEDLRKIRNHIGVHLRLTQQSPSVMTRFLESCRRVITHINDNNKNIQLIVEVPDKRFVEIICQHFVAYGTHVQINIRFVDESPNDMGYQTWYWLMYQ
jgi:hypothetical protein